MSENACEVDGCTHGTGYRVWNDVEGELKSCWCHAFPPAGGLSEAECRQEWGQDWEVTR